MVGRGWNMAINNGVELWLVVDWLKSSEGVESGFWHD